MREFSKVKEFLEYYERNTKDLINGFEDECGIECLMEFIEKLESDEKRKIYMDKLLDIKDIWDKYITEDYKHVYFNKFNDMVLSEKEADEIIKSMRIINIYDNTSSIGMGFKLNNKDYSVFLEEVSDLARYSSDNNGVDLDMKEYLEVNTYDDNPIQIDKVSMIVLKNNSLEIYGEKQRFEESNYDLIITI